MLAPENRQNLRKDFFMKSNKIVIVAGILLLAVTFFGILAYGKLMNPDPVYVLTAKSDINQGTSLVSLTQDNFNIVDISSSASMVGTFVTPSDFAKMQSAGGQFINLVSRNEPVKYTDIMSSANPLSSRIVSLGQDDPNKVVMTINVAGYAPVGIHEGDYVDIIGTVSTYDTADAYGNALANILTDARKKALAEIDAEELGEKISTADFGYADGVEFGSDYYDAVSGGFGSASADTNVFSVTQPSITDEIMEKADLLQEKTDELSAVLDEWKEFVDLWGSADPVALSEMLEAGYYLSPIAKVLVNGAKVINVNRTEDSYAAGVDSLDVLVPRDAIEWIAMAEEGGTLRIAILSSNANPNGSGATEGASMQDFIESFVHDRGDKTEYSVIPSSR